jgi:hypothetical protein
MILEGKKTIPSNNNRMTELAYLDVAEFWGGAEHLYVAKSPKTKCIS